MAHQVRETERTALVLAGGAARGAYEVGVALHLFEEVSRAIGRDVPIDVLSGTSVGAINASALAAFADRPRERAAILARHWTSLTLGDVIRLNARGLLGALAGLFGRRPGPSRDEARRGGVLDPTGVEQLIARAIPFARIEEHLRTGRLGALTMSATHVGTGRTTVFQQTPPRCPGTTSDDPTVLHTETRLTPEHALASAALPLLFPAVRIDGELYCDGGLRQNVPLMPALRLGADRLVVVVPRHDDAPATAAIEKGRERDFPGLSYLLGKALSSLLLDRVDNDLNRLQAMNELLEAGERSFGPAFTDSINAELVRGGRANRVRPIRTILIRASQDLGTLAAEYVRSPRFEQRASGVAVRILRRLAGMSGDADLLSYLLFDGEFAAQLIELGRADARRHHDELCALFADAIVERAAA